MRTTTLFLAFLFGSGSALIVKAPTAAMTDMARVPDSSASTAETTEAPAVHPALLRRGGITGTWTAFLAPTNICGYLNRASSIGIGCNVGYAARCGLFASASQGAMGCCYSPGNCAVFTTCIGYDMITSIDSCANYCGPNEDILQCTASGSYCSSFIMSNAFTDAVPGVEFTGYMCAQSPGDIAQQAYTFFTAFVNQTSVLEFATTTMLFLKGPSGSLTGSSTSAVPSSAAPSSPSVMATKTSSPLVSSPSAASTTGVSVGPIVGGVIGGVSVLIAVTAGIYLWRRKHRDSFKKEVPRDSAYLAQGDNAGFSVQELSTQEPVQELATEKQSRKKHVSVVAGDNAFHEIMGTEVHRR